MGGSGDFYRGMDVATRTRQYDMLASVADFGAEFAHYASLSQAAPARLERRASTVHDETFDFYPVGQNLRLYADGPDRNHFNLAVAPAPPGTALNSLLLAVIRRHP